MKIIKKITLCLFITLFICSFACARDYDGVFGIYRLELHEKSGTFTLSMLNSSGDNFKPIFNPLDNSSGTIFYLKVGSKIYPLSKLGGVPVVQSMNENRASITYNIKNVAEVSLNFSFVSSKTGNSSEDSDLAVVDVLVKNISKKTKVFSLRSVLDTFLGESTSVHFSTESLNVLNSEALFNSMYIDKWIKSSDGDNSIKILLDGETVTRPLSVVVANRDILTVDSWEPRIIPGRGFNSLFSLNNSAVGITWNSYKIAPEKLFGVRFYISGASGTEEPADANSYFFSSGKAMQSASFIYESDKLIAEEFVEHVVLSTSDKKEDDVDEKTESIVEEVENADNTEVVDESENLEGSDVINENENENLEQIEDTEFSEDLESEANTDNLPYVDITPDMLNLEYVSELIKEIEELEQNPDLYDANRILYLHTELDAILEILEQ